MLRTVFQGLLAAILGFVVVVGAVLIFQSLRGSQRIAASRTPAAAPHVQREVPPELGLYLPPLPEVENPAPRRSPADDGGFALPDRSAAYLKILVDTLAADREAHPERVRKALEALQRLDAPDPRIYRWLGAIYHREKRYEEAAAAFERAVELDPNNAADRFNLATVYLVQEHFPQAIRELNRVIRLQPPFLDDAYAYLGYCLHAMGDEKQARQAWEVSLQLDPNNPVARRYATIP